MNIEHFGIPAEAGDVEPGNVVLFESNDRLEIGFSVTWDREPSFISLTQVSFPEVLKPKDQAVLVIPCAVLRPNDQRSDISLVKSQDGQRFSPKSGTLVAVAEETFLVFVGKFGSNAIASVVSGKVEGWERIKATPLACFQAWEILLPSQSHNAHRLLMRHPSTP